MTQLTQHGNKVTIEFDTDKEAELHAPALLALLMRPPLLNSLPPSPAVNRRPLDAKGVPSIGRGKISQ